MEMEVWNSTEWNMEENFSMEWKIFGMEWKWNGRKLPVWNMEKSSSIPFHTMLCWWVTVTYGSGCCTNCRPTVFQTLSGRLYDYSISPDHFKSKKLKQN